MMFSPWLCQLCLWHVALGCTMDDTSSYHLLPASVRGSQKELTWEEELFLTVPSNVSARESLEFITSKPHVAGTAGDLEMAEYVRSKLHEVGIEALLDPQKVLLTYPITSALELLNRSGSVVAKASLAEDILKSDNTSNTWWRKHAFNGYSPSGDVTAPLIYANFGLPEDFATLKAAGVEVNGSIVLMRYGRCFRGLKAMNAEAAGAKAAIIYSDPEEDGYAKGSVYPYGPWRPKSSVQRGSIQFISLCAGDPTRAYAPHGKSVEELCGLSSKELIPNIPVMPISYGDALLFLESLGGQQVPEDFRGALNITYKFGPTTSKYQVRVRVQNRFQSSPVWNVIGKIPGTLAPHQDQAVVLGNHRDAWIYGAADPNSGTAQLLEVARGLGQLLKKGWRPLRTIYLCSWSGEEYGLLGSTAWGEVQDQLLRRALAYVNVDTGVSGPHFRASGTPSLAQLLDGVLHHVPHPGSGKPVAEQWNGKLFSLGSGSDYTIFIDHLGIPSLDMAFTPDGAQYGVYHSVYDSFTWMATEGDPNFSYHVAMARIWGLVTLRLSGTHVEPLPLNISIQADAIQDYILHIKENASHLDFQDLDDASNSFKAAAAQIMRESRRLGELGPEAPLHEVQALNDRLGLLERHFLASEGLPNRKWFKHVLQAPGLYTGYAAKTLPGIYEAIESKRWAVAQQQIHRAAERIRAAAASLVPSIVV